MLAKVHALHVRDSSAYVDTDEHLQSLLAVLKRATPSTAVGGALLKLAERFTQW
jgi:hypothetical protein